MIQHKGTTVIDTKRLRLRPFVPEDADPMFRNWASDKEVTKFLTWPTHGSKEVSAYVVEQWYGRREEPNYYQWAIELKELHEPIGSISATKVDDRTEAATIGYCIGRRWWGQGITAEDLEAVITFFFQEVGMNCISACHDPRNPNSGKVMKKCGMTREGTWRAGGVNNQGICDETWYSILRDEFCSRRDSCRQQGPVREIEDPGDKKAIAREILEDLSDWFGIREARETYIEESAGQPFWAAFREERPVGFLCLKETGQATAELSVMGVRRECHGQGIGRELFAAAKAWAKRQGYSFLQVKTVQMGHYENYDRTNRFYLSMGFKEFEVFPALWDKGNPCQIYVMEV